ncbi:Borealin N terminal-domain-containing protein [Coniochaeta sp. 2T2.1]|nr:Borealin N terminal-domain-containing protein [Coniochaeta sp. 2T2.1]
MPAPRGQNRKSNATTTDDHAPETATQRVATKGGDEIQESPTKKRKVGVGLTLAKKQALIDNLQLEVTERARRLRAQYNDYAQSLRNRVEMRVNKIPGALRKMKMGDLMAKRLAEEQQKTAAPSANAARPPPVPPKDVIIGRPALQRTAQGTATVPSPMRAAKRLSESISGGDKENEMTHIENPKKKVRANPTGAATRPAPNPSQVLSPASSNSRMQPPRERPAPLSPARSFIARPVSPTKPATQSSGMFSNMVEKARSTRAAATTRKTTTSSTASSANGSTAAAATRTRKAAAATAPASRAGATSRTTRRVSAISESSDGSTGTVVRKRTATAAAPAPAAKRTVMGTIRKGVTGTATKKAPVAKAKAAPAAATTGRVLRKRG